MLEWINAKLVEKKDPNIDYCFQLLSAVLSLCHQIEILNKF